MSRCFLWGKHIYSGTFSGMVTLEICLQRVIVLFEIMPSDSAPRQNCLTMLFSVSKEGFRSLIRATRQFCLPGRSLLFWQTFLCHSLHSSASKGQVLPGAKFPVLQCYSSVSSIQLPRAISLPSSQELHCSFHHCNDLTLSVSHKVIWNCAWSRNPQHYIEADRPLWQNMRFSL